MTTNSPEPLLEPSFFTALNRLSLSSRRARRGQLLGTRRSLRHGVSVEFSDFREYAPGDDLRTIDWKAYGRLDKLLVKLFREEDDLSLHLLLDASQSMMFGAPNKLRFAKQLCAVLGAIALLDFDRCSLNVLSGAQALRPSGGSVLRGRSSLPALLARLSSIEASGRARIAAALAMMTQRRMSPGALVLVSDFYDHQLTPGLLARAGRAMDVALLHIVSPEEIDPGVLFEAPSAGEAAAREVRLIDSESGEEMDLTLGADSILRYRQEFGAFCAELESIARAGGATYTRVSTDTDLSEVILGTLRASGVVA